MKREMHIQGVWFWVMIGGLAVFGFLAFFAAFWFIKSHSQIELLKYGDTAVYIDRREEGVVYKYWIDLGSPDEVVEYKEIREHLKDPKDPKSALKVVMIIGPFDNPPREIIGHLEVKYRSDPDLNGKLAEVKKAYSEQHCWKRVWVNKNTQ